MVVLVLNEEDIIVNRVVVKEDFKIESPYYQDIEGANIGDKIENGVVIHRENIISTQDMKMFLNDTEWVENYLIKHTLGIEEIPITSSKWDTIRIRDSYKSSLKSI